MATEGLTGLESALRQLISDLRHEEVPFALVGGLGVSVRAEPRLTRDADVAASVVITDRGYNRGRDLDAALASLISPSDRQ